MAETFTILRAEKKADKPDKGYGWCECGCGAKVPGRFKRGHNKLIKAPDYRVEDCGYQTACWIWAKALDRKGYGVVAVGRLMKRAHRVYYAKRHGDASIDSLQLDHLCRVPACVNPDHLEPVTNAENSQRGARAKLCPADVHAIRASSAPARVLASRFGVCRETISDVRARRKWANV